MLFTNVCVGWGKTENLITQKKSENFFSVLKIKEKWFSNFLQLILIFELFLLSSVEVSDFALKEYFNLILGEFCKKVTN